MIILIVAKSLNDVIGKDNMLPWYIPEELQTFKEITTGYPIVMGYNTYKSLRKPLPNRTNYVLVRNPPETKLEEGFRPITDTEVFSINAEKVFIIGGANTYKKFIHNIMLDVMYISYILDVYEGDTVLNLAIDPTEWSFSIYKKTDKFITVKYERR